MHVTIHISDKETEKMEHTRNLETNTGRAGPGTRLDAFYGLRFVRKAEDLGGFIADAITWVTPRTPGYKTYAVYDDDAGNAFTSYPQDAFTGSHLFLPDYPPIKEGSKLRLRMVGTGADGNADDVFSDYITVPDEDGGVVDPQIRDLDFVMEGGFPVAVIWSSPSSQDTGCIAKTVDSAGSPVGDFLSALYPASARKIPLRRKVYSGERIAVTTTPASGGEFVSNVLTVPHTEPLLPYELPESITNVRIAGGYVTWDGDGFLPQNQGLVLCDQDVGRQLDSADGEIAVIDWDPANSNRAHIHAKPGIPFRMVLMRKGTADIPHVYVGKSRVFTL